MDFLYNAAYRTGIMSRPVETVQCGLNLFCQAANHPYMTAAVATVTAAGTAAGLYFMSNKAEVNAPVVQEAHVAETVASRTRSKKNM